MSTKRKHSEVEVDIHPSRKSQVPGAVKKPRKAAPPSQIHKKQAHASSVNLIKKKIRDVTRRLERSEDLPANVKADDERALAAYQQELEEAEHEKIKQKMIKKYHMVRFFERQKATRLIKKLRKALITSTSEEEIAQLTTALHVADVDLNYTRYFPLTENYISIYRNKGDYDDSEAKPAEEVQKPEMWYEVERRMESGYLEQLRNGRRTTPVEKPKVERQLRISGANGEAVQAGAKKTRQAKPAQEGGSGRPATVQKLAKGDDGKQKPMSKNMTDDEFFKLNRREKRRELKKSGRLGNTFAAVPVPAQSGKEEEDSGHISDGGFFEE